MFCNMTNTFQNKCMKVSKVITNLFSVRGEEFSNKTVSVVNLSPNCSTRVMVKFSVERGYINLFVVGAQKVLSMSSVVMDVANAVGIVGELKIRRKTFNIIFTFLSCCG